MIDFSKMDQYRENNRIEAKKALGGLPHSIWETYSAFANTLGGILLLGVEEHPDHSLHTVDLPDPARLIREFWDIVNDPKKVSANILTDQQVQTVTVGGDHIIAITVPRALRQDRPVYIGGDPMSGSYRRSGEGDYRCTRDEVWSMLRDAAVQTQDMDILDRVDMDALDLDSIHRYRTHLQRRRTGWETLPDREFLEQLGAAGRDTSGVLHPTAAGLLMFGTEPAIVRQFPNYALEYRAQAAEPEGPPDRIVSDSGDWSGNLYDFYRLVQERLYGASSVDAVRDALREALVNCLLNADYHGKQGVVIARRGERIVLSNPGAFRIAVERARSGGVSDPRNAALTRMFHLVDLGERTGSGIPRIYAVWQQQGWEQPRIEERFSPDRTILQLVLDNAQREQPATLMGGRPAAMGPIRKQMIIEYLTEHIRASADELADKLQLEPDRALAFLDELMAEEIVIAHGDGPDRIYQLKA